jgi:hypothetical protein
MMAEDADERSVRLPKDELVASISALANQQLQLEKELEYEELKLEELKARLSRVRDSELPSLMEQAGVTLLKLLDGSLLEVKEDVYAGITEEHKVAAFAWLEETGNDGIIKNEIKAAFGKGQDAEAKELQALLNAHGYSYTALRSVHPQTLKAFVRKQLEAGIIVPTDVFSVHVKRSTKIVAPKK